METSDEVKRKMDENMGLIGDAYSRYRHPHGWEPDDWMGQLSLIYVKACRAHDPARGKLSTIYNNMIRHEWCEIREKRMTKKRNGGIAPLSLGELIDETGQGFTPSVIDRGHDLVDAKDELECIIPRLRPIERELFILFASGMSGPQIAKAKGWSYKSYPNRLMALARDRIRGQMTEGGN